jgi:hypothetical protein
MKSLKFITFDLFLNFPSDDWNVDYSETKIFKFDIQNLTSEKIRRSEFKPAACLYIFQISRESLKEKCNHMYVSEAIGFRNYNLTSPFSNIIYRSPPLNVA